MKIKVFLPLVRFSLNLVPHCGRPHLALVPTHIMLCGINRTLKINNNLNHRTSTKHTGIVNKTTSMRTSARDFTPFPCPQMTKPSSPALWTSFLDDCSYILGWYFPVLHITPTPQNLMPLTLWATQNQIPE